MSSMPIIAQRAPRPFTCRPLYLSAALALAVELLLLVGVGGWLIHPHIAAQRQPEPITITLTRPAVHAPKAVPIPVRDVTMPVPKPDMQPRRVPAAHQARVARAAAAPQPQPVTSPHAPARRTQAVARPPAQAPDMPQAPAQDTPPAQSTAPAPSPTPAPVNAAAHPDASFDATLRAAIQAALRYPASARMEGTTGRTLVAFVYRDGAVSGIHVVTSSGVGLLDHAALAAVRDAVCPPPPHGFEGASLPERLWVDFTLDEKA
jgi:protein TonB